MTRRIAFSILTIVWLALLAAGASTYFITRTVLIADLDDMILARVEIDYRSPLSLGEAVDVTVRCASMRRSSFVLEFAARERSADRLVAEARKVLVHYDYSASRSLELPAELRDLLRGQDPDVRDEAAP